MNTNPTIMFVDDDRDLLMAQEAYFSRRGYKVLTAATRERALALLAENTPDLIVLDLMMEHYDSGLTLNHELRKDARFAKLPIIMLSGVASTTRENLGGLLRDQPSWSKLDAFLDKPVTAQQLLRVIEEKLGDKVPNVAVTH